MENLTTQFASVSLVKEFKFIHIEELETKNDALIDWNNLLPQQLAQRFLELHFTAKDNSKMLMFQTTLFQSCTMENLTTQFASMSLVKEFKFIPIEELEPENDALFDWNTCAAIFRIVFYSERQF
jgi:hypothetical protein